ncbi:MAG: rod shape-determining protein MreC [Pseudomonadota bacterium]
MDYLGQDRREGLGRKANSRVLLFLLILVSIFLLLSSLYSAQASVFQKAREGVLDATSPILELFSGPIAAVNNAIGYVSDYFSVLEQNKALRDENAELRQWMNEALELRTVVAGYEGLAGYQAPPVAKPISAYVIGESNDVFAKSMIINAGRRQSVESGQAVVDADGMIGRIVNAGANASRVLLLTDVQSRVPVYIEGADAEGILVGRTRARPAIAVIDSPDEIEIRPGQRVLTSGAGGVLPRGLPIGLIEEGNGDITVDLYANYVRTRLVRVINYSFPAIDDASPLIDGASPAGAAGPESGRADARAAAGEG